VTDKGNIAQFEPYQNLWDSQPLQTSNDSVIVAKSWVTTQQDTIGWIHSQSPSADIFTSDYGLYWYDYQAGYNVVFDEMFGTQTDAQNLALVRDAADMQDKSWDVMIEWASQSPITLQTGSQMYGELEQAYKGDAEYAVVFNYSPSDNGAGTLQNEQYAALQRFWDDVVKNPGITNDVKGRMLWFCLTAAAMVWEAQTTRFWVYGNRTVATSRFGVPCRLLLPNTAQNATSSMMTRRIHRRGIISMSATGTKPAKTV